MTKISVIWSVWGTYFIKHKKGLQMFYALTCCFTLFFWRFFFFFLWGWNKHYMEKWSKKKSSCERKTPPPVQNKHLLNERVKKHLVHGNITSGNPNWKYWQRIWKYFNYRVISQMSFECMSSSGKKVLYKWRLWNIFTTSTRLKIILDGRKC